MARLRRIFRPPCVASIASGALVLAAVIATGVSPSQAAGTSGSTGTNASTTGIQKIKHVIIIMQENRSFDSYFGTYPGADGIPMTNGAPSVCVPDFATGTCLAPFHTTADSQGGGPHGYPNAVHDVDNGKMDGFIGQWLRLHGCLLPTDPVCATLPTIPNVIGYHTAAEIPNYWTYANDFVLNDHMFEAVKSWSLPEHLFLVSGWSALCTSALPSSCANDIIGPQSEAAMQTAVDEALSVGTANITNAWTDITYLLHANNVSWAYYVQTGDQPDCENDASGTCPPVAQNYNTPGIWNPLPLFTDVQQDHQLSNIKPLVDYFIAALTGTLPAVTWITPSADDSEHPPASVHQGQAYVTALINAAMKSPDWSSTAIFLSWDDWGGLYDHVVPPNADQNGYGVRVPALVISPYAKQGYVDSQTLSSDAYLKFIEDDFLNGARLDPAIDGRPDSRPDVRENASILGNLSNDFDFNQTPRSPVLLPTNPPTDSPSIPGYFTGKGPCVGCTSVPP